MYIYISYLMVRNITKVTNFNKIQSSQQLQSSLLLFNFCLKEYILWYSLRKQFLQWKKM